MKKFNSRLYLINTGWSAGGPGVGKRMDLKITRRIIDAIHNGELDNVETNTLPVFGFKIPKNV